MQTVAVVGLGYVGLPLALALGRHFRVVAHDIDPELVQSLRDGVDPTGETPPSMVMAAQGPVFFTTQTDRIGLADVVVVAVPTPIDATRRPDLSALRAATEVVGRQLRKGTLVVYESTVYPGCTEDVCLPILERESGLTCDADFDLAYSPERVSPGDAARTLQNVDKLVGARTDRGRERAVALYRRVVDATVHPVSSIRVAEAAKVLENVQRDLNIALMNECARIFDRAGIDTNEVIDAAATKWNFHPYRPGLVGGHCISVDPYYLTHFAERLDYRPEVIQAGRRVNDSMGTFVAQKLVRELAAAGRPVAYARVGVLGLTFKEDIADLRNTRVVELVAELRSFNVRPILHDPVAAPSKVEQVFGDPPVQFDELNNLDAAVIAVPHHALRETSIEALLAMFAEPSEAIILDVRGMVSDEDRGRFRYWCL